MMLREFYSNESYGYRVLSACITSSSWRNGCQSLSGSCTVDKSGFKGTSPLSIVDSVEIIDGNLRQQLSSSTLTLNFRALGSAAEARATASRAAHPGDRDFHSLKPRRALSSPVFLALNPSRSLFSSAFPTSSSPASHQFTRDRTGPVTR